MYLFFNELEFGIFTDKYELYIAVRNSLQSVEIDELRNFQRNDKGNCVKRSPQIIADKSHPEKKYWRAWIRFKMTPFYLNLDLNQAKQSKQF